MNKRILFALAAVPLILAGSAFGQTTNCGTGNADVCTTPSTAKLGVGAAPQAKLHVTSDDNEAMRLTRSNAGWSYIATYRGATRQGVMGDLFTNGFGLWADGSTPLSFMTNSYLRMLIDSSGNVAIGKPAAGFPLDVNGFVASSVMPPNDTTSTLSGFVLSNRGPGGGAYQWRFMTTTPDGGYGLSPNGMELYEYPNSGQPACCIPRFVIRKASSTTTSPGPMVIDGRGWVAVNLWAPSYTLDVGGTFHASGDAIIDGNIAAKYQDVAEWVDASQSMSPGTVVVIDPDAINGVRPSSGSYDTSVAGVVSAQPGVILGQAGQSKEKIATTGRVKVRVDATRRPVRTGDLLVTSDEPGVAMPSEPIEVGGVKIHRPGTLIGKALEPLPSGKGEILVLLSLQ